MAFTAEVARSAGVSPSTVSLVVNGKGRLSESTRRKVQRVIDRLGHLARRRPASPRRALEIAAIYCRNAVHNGVASQFTGQIIEGMRREITRVGALMSLFQGHAHVKDDLFLQQRLDKGGFDGVVVIGPGQRDGYVESFTSQPSPLVVINRQAQFNQFSTVCADYFGGGRLAVEHLLSLGHERIALLFDHHRRWPSRPILSGSLEALRQRGLEPALMPAVDPLKAPAELAQRVLDSGATAIFSGDYACAELLRVYHDLGVSVPGDMSVLGFDDLGMVSPRGLKLTSIGYDKPRIGKLAAAAVLRLARRRTVLKRLSVCVKVKLSPGQTTAGVGETVEPPAGHEA